MKVAGYLDLSLSRGVQGEKRDEEVRRAASGKTKAWRRKRRARHDKPTLPLKESQEGLEKDSKIETGGKN